MRKTNRIIPVICGPCKQSSRGASIVLLAQEGKLALDDEERKNISDAAADLLGCADAGAISPGKRADLLAVAGDTAAEITALKKVVIVVQSGEIVVNSAGRVQIRLPWSLWGVRLLAGELEGVFTQDASRFEVAPATLLSAASFCTTLALDDFTRMSLKFVKRAKFNAGLPSSNP